MEKNTAERRVQRLSIWDIIHMGLRFLESSVFRERTVGVSLMSKALKGVLRHNAVSILTCEGATKKARGAKERMESLGQGRGCHHTSRCYYGVFIVTWEGNESYNRNSCLI